MYPNYQASTTRMGYPLDYGEYIRVFAARGVGSFGVLGVLGVFGVFDVLDAYYQRFDDCFAVRYCWHDFLLDFGQKIKIKVMIIKNWTKNRK